MLERSTIPCHSILIRGFLFHTPSLKLVSYLDNSLDGWCQFSPKISQGIFDGGRRGGHHLPCENAVPLGSLLELSRPKLVVHKSPI